MRRHIMADLACRYQCFGCLVGNALVVVTLSTDGCLRCGWGVRALHGSCEGWVSTVALGRGTCISCVLFFFRFVERRHGMARCVIFLCGDCAFCSPNALFSDGSPSSVALAEESILLRIFSFLDRTSNYHNSLVCSQWRRTASLSVWHTVDLSVFRCLGGTNVDAHGVTVSSCQLDDARK